MQEYGGEMERLRPGPGCFNDCGVSKELKRPVIICNCSGAGFKILGEYLIKAAAVLKVGVAQDYLFIVSGQEIVMQGIQIKNERGKQDQQPANQHNYFIPLPHKNLL